MTIATFSDRTATFPQTAATTPPAPRSSRRQHVGKAYRASAGKEADRAARHLLHPA